MVGQRRLQVWSEWSLSSLVLNRQRPHGARFRTLGHESRVPQILGKGLLLGFPLLPFLEQIVLGDEVIKVFLLQVSELQHSFLRGVVVATHLALHKPPRPIRLIAVALTVLAPLENFRLAGT